MSLIKNDTVLIKAKRFTIKQLVSCSFSFNYQI